LERGEAQAHFQTHGLHFVDVARVFDGPTFTFEDDRFEYSEQRVVSLGLLDGFVVSIVHTESMRQIRVISFRKATKHEQTIYFKNL
jgi:hypothetical protein